MGFWNAFKEYGLPAIGGLIGGSFGDTPLESAIGSAVGAGAGTAVGGGDLKDIGLNAVLAGGSRYALPYITDALGIQSTGIPFLDTASGTGQISGVLPTGGSEAPWGTSSGTLTGDAGNDTLGT